MTAARPGNAICDKWLCISGWARRKHDAAMTALLVADRAPSRASTAIVETTIPARLDRLRWGRFHTLVVVALGITWVLDGLEVTLAGAISPALKESPLLRS